MRKSLSAIAVSILLMFTWFPGRADGQNKPGLSLREVFDIYVQSIHSSDLESLFSTVTESEKFFFLTSDGKLIDTRTDYY